MKEPVDHILRPSLPWRTEPSITECGYDASKMKVLTRAEFFQRVKDLGQQRTAMLTCMTCSNTAQRHGSWDDDPRHAILREVEWEGSGRWAHKERGARMRDELLAIADLIEAHREEFAAHITNTEQRRDWLEKKADSASKKKQATVPMLKHL